VGVQRLSSPRVLHVPQWTPPAIYILSVNELLPTLSIINNPSG
jgi:hypothetical protein